MGIAPKTEEGSDAPVTLHRVLRETIAKGLHPRYEPIEEIPHNHLVLLMQMNDEKRQKRKRKERL